MPLYIHLGQLWPVKDGAIVCDTAAGDIFSKHKLGSAQIHVEFREPAQSNPPRNPQYHGNSGVFPMGLYEVQILDGTNNQTYPDGMVGSIYSQNPPLANAGRPPAESKSPAPRRARRE